MIDSQIRTAEPSSTPEPSERYLKALLEVEAAIAKGTVADLPSESLAGLSQDELVRLHEACQCLGTLYDSVRNTRRRQQASAVTVTLPASADADASNPGGGASCDASDEDDFFHETRLGRFEIVREIGRGGAWRRVPRT